MRSYQVLCLKSFLFLPNLQHTRMKWTLSLHCCDLKPTVWHFNNIATYLRAQRGLQSAFHLLCHNQWCVRICAIVHVGVAIAVCAVDKSPAWEATQGSVRYTCALFCTMLCIWCCLELAVWLKTPNHSRRTYHKLVKWSVTPNIHWMLSICCHSSQCQCPLGAWQLGFTRGSFLYYLYTLGVFLLPSLKRKIHSWMYLHICIDNDTFNDTCLPLVTLSLCTNSNANSKSMKQEKECYIFPSTNTLYSFQEIQIHTVKQYYKCVRWKTDCLEMCHFWNASSRHLSHNRAVT